MLKWLLDSESSAGKNTRIYVMKTQCPHCKARFNTPDKNAGKQAKCPKCGEPFTIEAFVEMPLAAKPPATTPKPAETPVKKPELAESPEPAAPPAKSPQPTTPPVKKPEPIEPPVKSSKPIESPVPAAPPVKSPEPVIPPAKSERPVEAPVEKTEPVAPPAKSEAPVETPAKVVVPIVPPAKVAEPTKEQKPKSKALSKLVFVYCWIAVRIIAGVLGTLGLMLAIRKEAHSTLIATFAAADVFLVISVLIELMLFYKMWSAIQDGQASLSPGRAVTLLFIPVFDIYWSLLMLTGFAEDYNSFKNRYSVRTKDLSFVLFLIYAFLFILSAMVVTIPMIGVFAFVGLISRAFVGYRDLFWIVFSLAAITGLGHFVAYILVATKTYNAINAVSGK